MGTSGISGAGGVGGYYIPEGAKPPADLMIVLSRWFGSVWNQRGPPRPEDIALVEKALGRGPPVLNDAQKKILTGMRDMLLSIPVLQGGIDTAKEAYEHACATFRPKAEIDALFKKWNQLTTSLNKVRDDFLDELKKFEKT